MNIDILLSPLFTLFAILGTDEFGEPCHGGMYKHLWSNGPKEGLEYPYYTFTDHFGKAIPSFLPRPAMRDYLEGIIAFNLIGVFLTV